MRLPPRLTRAGLLLASALVLGVGLFPVTSGETAGGLGARFVKGALARESSSRVTTLQFGPDGRLYVGQQNGLIKAYTIERRGPGTYRVIGSETIAAVQAIPNHDDDGAVNRGVFTRLLTGILVTGTPDRPVIYATSSDPRIGGGRSGKERRLDTNSGVLSRLTREGRLWRRLDLVRGLPRSEQNHATNGVALDATGHRLYLAQGGMTNNGAPSTHFAFTPEYALSAAILSVDLAAIGEATYDLPTLDDTTRAGTVDRSDPFGGHDGRNQARLEPGGPVQVHASGLRNPYDLVLTASGRLYTIDNGANKGWGDVPEDEGPAGRCTNEVREKGDAQPDVLHLVTEAGYYGHPNPTRANRANRFNPDGQSPVEVGRDVECDHRQGQEAGALASFEASTNGLAEYRAGNLGGALAGDLLAAGFDNRVWRLELTAEGRVARQSVLFDEVATVPLDVTAQGDNDPFPGTVWVGDIGDGSITVFEPEDFGGRAPSATSAVRPPGWRRSPPAARDGRSGPGAGGTRPRSSSWRRAGQRGHKGESTKGAPGNGPVGGFRVARTAWSGAAAPFRSLVRPASTHLRKRSFLARRNCPPAGSRCPGRLLLVVSRPGGRVPAWTGPRNVRTPQGRVLGNPQSG